MKGKCRFNKRKKLTGQSNYKCALRLKELIDIYNDRKEDKYLNVTARDIHIATLWFIEEKGPNEIESMNCIKGKRGYLSADMILLEINRLFDGIIEYDEKPNVSKRKDLKEHQKLRKKLITDNPDAKCNCCGSKERLQIDHILAIGIGGTDELSNVQVLCEKCHKKKTKREREEYGWNKSFWSKKKGDTP